MRQWMKLSLWYEHASLDDWIIMPNHVHGIIIINPAIHVRTRRGGASVRRSSIIGAPIPGSSINGPSPPRVFGGLIKCSISSMINHFKGSVKRECNQRGFEFFGWHTRFYDHVIRNENSLFNIRQYIRDNSAKWYRDRNNPRYQIFSV